MREPATGRTWASTLGVGLLVLLVLALVTLGAMSPWGEVISTDPRPMPTVETETELITQSAAPPPSIFPEDMLPPPTEREVPQWLRELLGALGVVLAGVLLAWLGSRVAKEVRGRRLRKAKASAGTADEVPEVAQEEVAESFGVTLERLRAGMDMDDAIIQCWRRLEQVAEVSGVARKPHQTSEEFTIAIVSHAVVDSDALGELASLYRQAMFSTHVLDDDDRARAVECLERLVSQLRPTTGPVHG